MEATVLPLRLPAMILFGRGASERVGSEAKALAAKRVFAVCDSGIASTGMLDE